MFNSSKEVSSLKKLLTIYSTINNRQTVFASASIPQHKRFVYDCIQQKWTKVSILYLSFPTHYLNMVPLSASMKF